MLSLQGPHFSKLQDWYYPLVQVYSDIRSAEIKFRSIRCQNSFCNALINMPRPILTYNLQIALSVANSLLHFNLYSFWVRQQVFYNSSHYINKSSLESRGKSMKCAKSCPTTQVYIEARWTTKSFRTVEKKDSN